MKRFLKRMALVLGVAFLGLLVVLLWERGRGAIALKRELRRLAAQGDSLAASTFALSAVSAMSNAAPVILANANAIRHLKDGLTNAPDFFEFREPGRLGSIFSKSGEAPKWKALENALKNHADLIRVLTEASARPHYQSSYDYAKGFDDMPMDEMILGKQAVWALLRQSMADLRAARFEEGHRRLLGGIQMIAKQRDPLIILQLVRSAEEPAALAVTWQALQYDGWTDTQLRELQESWASVDFMDDMERALLMERAMNVEILNRLRNSPAARVQEFKKREERASNELLAGLVAPRPTTGWKFWWVNLPLWRLAWIDQDELRMLRKWEPIIALQRQAKTNSFLALKGFLEDTSDADSTWWDRYRFLMSSENFSVTPSLVAKSMKTQTEIHLVVSAIALRRFRTSAGRWPGRLDELAPRYLPSVPRDLMDGQPLRYRQEEDRFVLYSVGENGNDDSGDPTPQKGEYKNIWSGKDAVWPKP